MKKLLRLLGMLLFVSGLSFAQTTTVTATVTDSDSTLWANGTVSVQFVPNPLRPSLNVYRINGAPLSSAVIMQGPISLGSGGNFSVTVYNNTQVTPSGSQWQFTVCPNAISKCGSVTTAVSGSGQSITTLVDAAIPAPRFPAVAGSYGYADVETILTTPVGGTYWNVTSACQKYYNGSSWGCVSSGGGTGGTGDLSGTLTPGIIPVATAPHALGDSSVDQDLTNGGSVTIGLNNPLYPTTATCDGTECTVTVGNNYAVDQNVLLGDDFSESCLTDSGEVNVDTASSTQFTFAENETSCTGVISSTGGTITNYYEGFIVNSDENRIAQFLHSGGAYIHNNTVVAGEPLGDLSVGICLTTSTAGDCIGDRPETDSDLMISSGMSLLLYSDSPADATLNDSQICTMTTGCGGSGSPSINVDGVTISSPNLDSTAPVADSGYTLGTWKESGSNISVEVPTVTASQVNTLLQGLTGCNTAGYLYSPQSGTCVAPSGGYTPTQSVVTSSRVFGTIYQNTTGHLIMVTVGVWSNLGIGQSGYTVKSDSGSTPSTVIVSLPDGNDSSITSGKTITFMVLSGNYYQVTTDSETTTVYSWTEWTIG